MHKNAQNKILISAHAWVKMFLNAMLVARLASSRVAKCILDQVEANLAEIQPKTTKMAKKRIFCKKLQESVG